MGGALKVDMQQLPPRMERGAFHENDLIHQSRTKLLRSILRAPPGGVTVSYWKKPQTRRLLEEAPDAALRWWRRCPLNQFKNVHNGRQGKEGGAGSPKRAYLPAARMLVSALVLHTFTARSPGRCQRNGSGLGGETRPPAWRPDARGWLYLVHADDHVLVHLLLGPDEHPPAVLVRERR